ncbi:hypothetical protein IQ277_06620 [Nostocales cyanobacterium LEGE 12452]|nr:hypothetical protein [Nostocales cyanobacterium LEGE 12452]
MLRFYKNCIIEFFASEDYTWGCCVTFPNEDWEDVGDGFISWESAYFKATQAIDIGLIAMGQASDNERVPSRVNPGL